MKLLLSSSGLANSTIASALEDLTRKSPCDTKVAFVPTALNAEPGNKDWAINQFLKFWRFGYNNIDIIDPSAAEITWDKRLDACDVIFICGGNTFHLLDQSRKSGFDAWIADNVEHKVFVGSSAGSILLTPNIGIAAADYGDENYAKLEDLTGLGLVDFEVAPHYEQTMEEVIIKYSETTKNQLYAIDDSTAVMVNGGHLEVVTEGFWKLIEH